MSTKIEFDVKMSCDNCASSVKKALLSTPGIDGIEVKVDAQSVIVDTKLPSQTVKEVIESTGTKAVLKGYGLNKLGSAVAELKCDAIQGVIRFHQKENNTCIIDGTVDGLSPGEHGLHIHSFGDFSEGFDRLGPHYNPDNSEHGAPSDKNRHYGDLGNITADKNGRANFIVEDHVVKVWDIIGRSIAITSEKDDLGHGENTLSKITGNSGSIVAGAIIARSAGLFQNPKRICLCDGVTIWEEKIPASL